MSQYRFDESKYQTRMQYLRGWRVFLWKWGVCSWLHRRYHCGYGRGTTWHCNKCHPCNEVLDAMLECLVQVEPT